MSSGYRTGCAQESISVIPASFTGQCWPGLFFPSTSEHGLGPSIRGSSAGDAPADQVTCAAADAGRADSVALELDLPRVFLSAPLPLEFHIHLLQGTWYPAPQVTSVLCPTPLDLFLLLRVTKLPKC